MVLPMKYYESRNFYTRHQHIFALLFIEHVKRGQQRPEFGPIISGNMHPFPPQTVHPPK
jgi:hypothetical protein